jgi:hypothetical protein
VGASLLAMRPVHPKHLQRQSHRIREQARSHSFFEPNSGKIQ